MKSTSDGGFEASEWFYDMFGEQSEESARALYGAALAAHGRASDAKAGSRLRTNEPYGATFWVALPEEVLKSFAFFPGLETIRLRHGRYELPVCNETLLLAVKMPANGRGPDELRIKSKFRRRLLSMQSLDDAVSPLDFGDFEFADAVGEPVVIEGEFGSAKRVVLVVVECSARGGVRRIHIGDVVVLADGHIVWTYREELPLSLLAGSTTGLVGLSMVAEGSSFADAPIPQAPLGLVEAAAGNDQNGMSEVDDTGTEWAVRDGS